VYQTGDVPCPAGYTNKQVFYDAFDDTRGCTTCTCGVATGNCVGGSVSLHNASDCSDAGTSLNLSSCTPAPTTTHAKYSDGAATNVKCPATPSSGLATGAATPKNAVTFCCLN
jgi:hypothetical protein